MVKSPESAIVWPASAPKVAITLSFKINLVIRIATTVPVLKAVPEVSSWPLTIVKVVPDTPVTFTISIFVASSKVT